LEKISKELSIATLADLFWSIWHKGNYQLPKDTSKCYIFEMCSEAFPFIVRYPSGDRLTLIGVRDIPSLREFDIQSFAEENGWPHWVQMTPIEEFLRNQRTERPFWVRKPLPKGTTRWRNRKTRAKHNRIG
jgi:hypothetical protein